MNTQEKRRSQAKAAMPEVKKLVKKYGRTAVNNCLLKIRDFEKSEAKLQALKKEVASLERKIK